MDNQTESEGRSQLYNDRRNKLTVVIVILILLMANGFFLWQFFTKKQENLVLVQEKMTLISQKDSLTREFENVKADLGALQTEFSGLQSQLTERDLEIEKQKGKIEQLLRQNAGIGALKAEINKLKDLKTQYEGKISELEKQNAELINQNQTLNSNLAVEVSKNENLNKENQGLSQKVAVGSILKADDIIAMGVRFKSSGKEVIEYKAKSVQKIKTCFTILENRVVDKGLIEVFLRILGPDKSLMTTSSGTFLFNAQQLPYSQKQEINYDNKNYDQCVYWEKGSLFAKGSYTVEIYARENKIGESTFILK